MKKYLTKEGKTAIAIIFCALILSAGFFLASNHKAEGRMIAVELESYDGGGGGGGSSATPTALTSADGNNAVYCKDGKTVTAGTEGATVYTKYQTGLPLPEYWPKPGAGSKNLEWCSNCSTREYRTVCRDTTLVLQEKAVSTNEGIFTSICEQAGGDAGICNQLSIEIVALSPPSFFGNLYPIPAYCFQVGGDPSICNGIADIVDQGTFNYGWSDSKTVPNGCAYSAPNACGEKTLGVNDSTLVPPPVPSWEVSTSCKVANACGATANGEIACGRPCSAVMPALPNGYGNTCTATNKNGKIFTGEIGCNGCSATPVDDECEVKNACQTASNKGILVNGVCNASAPAEPSNGTVKYGDSCVSSTNNVGSSNTGIIKCDLKCSAATPSNETWCTAANKCGDLNSGWSANGVCKVTAPSERQIYLDAGICIDPVCSITQQLNPSTHKCVPKTCGACQYLDGNTGKCEAVTPPPGFHFDAPACVAITDIKPQDGVCSTTVVDNGVGIYVDRDDTTTQYLWTFKGIGAGAKDAQCAIDKIIPPAPTVTVHDPEITIKQGNSDTFTWDVSNATVCTLLKDGIDTGRNALINRSYTDTPSIYTVYEIKCTNVAGEAPYKTASATHKVTVTPPPAILVVKFPGFTNKIAFGETENRELVITNQGGSVLGVENIVLKNTKNAAFSIDGSFSPFKLSPGDSKTFNVIYKPDVKNFSDTLKKSEDTGEISISSNVGNETVVLYSSGVYAVSGAQNLNVGDVPAGISRIFKYPVRNNTEKDLYACLKFNKAESPFSFEGAKSITHLIGNGVEYVFGITFIPLLGSFITNYDDLISVGISPDNKCTTFTEVYKFKIEGRGVKPVTTFNEM